MPMKEIKDDTNRKIYHALDWKNQYCQNDYSTQGNLQIQCNPYQIAKDIFGIVNWCNHCGKQYGDASENYT